MLKLLKFLIRNSLTQILFLQFIFIAILSVVFSSFFSNKITEEYAHKFHHTEEVHFNEFNRSFSENLKRSEKNVALLAKILSSLKGDYTVLQKSAPLKYADYFSGESMDFFNLNGKCLTCENDSIANKIWNGLDSSKWIHSPEFTGRFVRYPVYDTDKLFGYFCAKISLARLLPAFSTNKKSQYALADENKNLLYASKSASSFLLQKYIEEASQSHLNKGFLNDSTNSNHIYFIKEKNYTLFFLHQNDPADELNKFLYLSNLIIILIILICFVSNAFFIFYHLLRPIIKVNRKIQKIAENNWQGKINQRTRIKELRELFNILDSQLQLIQGQQKTQNEHREYLEKEILKKIEELESANQRLQEISKTDELTGLPNRRDIKEKIALEISRAKRFHSNFSLLLLDIDYFKKINDTFGHLAGDYVLKEFANIAQKLLRKYDHAARFGGEEFLIVLPETNEESAKIVAERFRSFIEAYPFDYNGNKLRITVSIGIVLFDQNTGLEGSLLLADKALYRSKENGRNQITVWTPDLK